MKATISSFLAFLCISVAGSRAQAIGPPPDGGYPGGNTAEGQNALFSLTSGGYNTAVGFFSLRINTTGQLNTATGAGTLLANTGDENTAIGAGALLSNTTGGLNAASGAFALFTNTAGFRNTASGDRALFSNTIGTANTADGAAALNNNNIGNTNTAIGADALQNNTTGSGNMAAGDFALGGNTTGNDNIAVGALAGINVTTGNYNIDIGNAGVAGDTSSIRIGDDNQGQTFVAGVYGVSVAGLGVAMNSSGQLGTIGSSRRFKKEIKAMKQASETILSLKPVTFRYTKEIDPEGLPQYGLVAEEVEKVSPDLVVRDKEGKPYSVRYDQVNAMLLNEFLKEHKAFIDERHDVEKLQATVASLVTTVKQQAVQLQKVSAQVRLNSAGARVVVSNH